MLPIDWPTLGLQLAALLVIVVSALAGLQGVARRHGHWLRAIGSWGDRLAPRLLADERLVPAGLGLSGMVFAVIIGRLIFDDYPFSGDEWSYVPQAKRSQVLQEARRVLKGEGRLLITMINPVVGFFAHTIRHRYDLDQLERGMGEEEAKGLWHEDAD